MLRNGRVLFVNLVEQFFVLGIKDHVLLEFGCLFDSQLDAVHGTKQVAKKVRGRSDVTFGVWNGGVVGRGGAV